MQNRLELKRTGLKKIKWSQGFWLHIFFNYLQWNHICMNPFEGLHCLRNFKFVSTNYKYILIKIHVFNRQSSHRKISMILVNKVLWKWKFSKNVTNKNHAPKLIFFNEKKIEKDSDNFWRRKLTLKVRNCHFSIAWFRAEVDLTKNLFYEKVLFFTQITFHLMSSLLKKS